MVGYSNSDYYTTATAGYRSGGMVKQQQHNYYLATEERYSHSCRIKPQWQDTATVAGYSSTGRIQEAGGWPTQLRSSGWERDGWWQGGRG